MSSTAPPSSSSTSSENDTLPPFDPSDPQIRRDIFLLMLQFLQDEGYHHAYSILVDENSSRIEENAAKFRVWKKLKKCILDGDWNGAEKICLKARERDERREERIYRSSNASPAVSATSSLISTANHKPEFFGKLSGQLSTAPSTPVPISALAPDGNALTTVHSDAPAENINSRQGGTNSLYTTSISSWLTSPSILFSIYKQHYLEMIDRAESQKAFAFLARKMKPMEKSVDPNEFANLCYLLTCKSVMECTAFSDWGGISYGRQQLINKLERMLKLEIMLPLHPLLDSVPPRRLITLLERATRYRQEHHPAGAFFPSKITRLLHDITPCIIPNTLLHTCNDHSGNIKVVQFVGENGGRFVTGSSDSTLKLWNTSTGKCLQTLKGHTGRIWDVDILSSGNGILSASADFSIRYWKNYIGSEYSSSDSLSSTTLVTHTSDVYSVRIHPSSVHFVTAGYAGVATLYDLNNQQPIRTFSHHSSAITSLAFSPIGHLLFTGSKDSSIAAFDLMSGVCVHHFDAHLSEVTSVEIDSSGMYLLSCSKDNSTRLWDLRQQRVLYKYTGQRNTTKNYIRSHFACNDTMIIGGSEDGSVCCWKRDTEVPIDKSQVHQSCVYDVRWHQELGVWITASEDETIKIWGIK